MRGVIRSGLTLSAAFTVALAADTVVTTPVNRWMVSRGLGHAVVHSDGSVQSDGNPDR